MSKEREIHKSIAAKYPALVRRARTNSPLAAIRCFCLECVGESPAVIRDCSDNACFLWPFRFGKGFESNGLPVPQKAELTDEQRERIAKMQAARK